MYHCHLQFYLTGYQNSIFEVIKKTAPLENFNHEFSESDEPDGALAAGADVILANLQGMNAKEALYTLLGAKKKEADLILVLAVCFRGAGGGECAERNPGYLDAPHV